MREQHPYGEFIPKGATGMIIGSFPIGKFSDPKRRHEILPHEMDFYFGGERNLLWKLIGAAYGRELKTKEDVIAMLEEKHLGIGDVIRSCCRVKGRASDSDLYDIEWNVGLIDVLRKNKIKTVYLTSKQVQRWFHQLNTTSEYRVEEVLLISPSAQSSRAVVRRKDYQDWKKDHPNSKTWEFLLVHYKQVFI